MTVDVGDAPDVGGPLPSLSVGDATVEEGGTAEFEVTLEPPSSQTVTVAFATGDDTAEAGTDYESKSGTLRFTVGQTVQTISVPTVDDTFPRIGGTLHPDPEQTVGGHAGHRCREGDDHG